LKTELWNFPDLTEMFASSRNAARLQHAWVEWRKATGATYRQAYLDFIEINNEAAKSLGKLSESSLMGKTEQKYFVAVDA
jgi:hypothetical protein